MTKRMPWLKFACPRSANWSPRRPSANGSRSRAMRSLSTSRWSSLRPTRSRSRCRRRPPACWPISRPRTATPSRSARCSARSRKAPARCRPAARPASRAGQGDRCRRPKSRSRGPSCRRSLQPAAAQAAPTRRWRRRCARSPPRPASTPRRVAGTGKDGRVTKGDMLAAIERAAAQPTPVARRPPPCRCARRRRPTMPRARSACA